MSLYNWRSFLLNRWIIDFLSSNHNGPFPNCQSWALIKVKGQFKVQRGEAIVFAELCNQTHFSAQYDLFNFKKKTWNKPINRWYTFYMSHAPPYSKTGHLLLHASKTSCVSIPCRLDKANEQKVASNTHCLWAWLRAAVVRCVAGTLGWQRQHIVTETCQTTEYKNNSLTQLLRHSC